MEVRSKSFLYRVAVEWKGEKKGLARCEGKPDLEVASPPEFKGHPGIWSPEDLFVEAINACTMTTFLALAARANLEPASYRSVAEGTLERGADGFSFTRVVVRPVVGVRSEADRAVAAEVLGKVEHACLISRSVRSAVTIEAQVEVS